LQLFDLLLVVVTLAGAVLAALLISSFIWRPNHRVDRSKFAHWLKSLIRNYAEGAQILVRHRTSPVAICVVHEASHDGQCCLSVRIPSAPWSDSRKTDLSKALLIDDSVSYDPVPETLLAIRVDIPDIWIPSAADSSAQVLRRTLDVLGLPPTERFDFHFSGDRSLELVKEIRRRQKAGLLDEW
jgi:hypothetical protein